MTTVCALALSATAPAEGDMSHEALAAGLVNPDVTLGSLNFPIDSTSYKNALEQRSIAK